MKNDNLQFSGKVVLVVGGWCALGRGIIHSFLTQGATLIVPVKSLHELEEVKAYKDNKSYETLVTHLTDVPDFDKAIEIAETIEEKFGSIDIAIKIFDPGLCSQQLTDVHINDWIKMTDEDITPFFVCARAVLNLMKEKQNGFFVSITGSPLVNKEHASPLSEISCSMKMEMSKIFAREVAAKNVKYYHLSVTGTPDKEALPGKEAQAIQGEEIGKHIMKLYGKKEYCADNIFQSLDAGFINQKSANVEIENNATMIAGNS